MQELNEIEQRWVRQKKLLDQLNFRLLEQSYGETFGFAVEQTQKTLTELQSLAQNLPIREPLGPNYLDARDGLHACLSSLRETLKQLEKVKMDAHVSTSEIGWQRVLDESTRRR